MSHTQRRNDDNIDMWYTFIQQKKAIRTVLMLYEIYNYVLMYYIR